MKLSDRWRIYNPSGKNRILITKTLPGKELLNILTGAGYRTVVCSDTGSLSVQDIVEGIGSSCTAVIGQLTEKWDSGLFEKLSGAGGVAYCNFAVGYDNVDLDAATKNLIAVGNTPGVLTETTAEMAVALTMACARRIKEADAFTRSGRFKGWQPDLFLGKRLRGSTLGVIGSGRIGTSYALTMVRAFQMNLVYFDHKRNQDLENELETYNDYLLKNLKSKINVNFADSVNQVLSEADIVSLHVPLTSDTRYFISNQQLLNMKSDAILINTSRGAVINEAELAEHCKTHPEFTAGLDVFEQEPVINDLLKKLPNVTLAPHIASATRWTRENMSKLAALNIKGVIEGYPAWDKESIDPFLGDNPPEAIPSILNKTVLKII